MSSVTALLKQFPSIGEIEKVSKITEPVSRNLNITQSYFEISRSFASRAGDVSNWCTFATWASKQAGATIRGEDLRNKLLDALSSDGRVQSILKLILLYAKQIGKEAGSSIHLEALKNIVETSQKHASNAVSRGNKKVYEEIAREFSRFMDTCMKDECYDPSSIKNFCSSLSPGLPPSGQDHLALAFNLYYQALFEIDPKTKQQLFYFANVLVGYHEQTRLQPEILESMNAARINAAQLKDRLTSMILAHKSAKGKFFYFLDWIVGKTDLLKKSIESLVAEAESHIRKVITDQLMTLRLPTGEVLELGDDLLAEPCAELLHLDHESLINLLAQLRPSPDVKDGAGCSDWSNLPQRIHYIAHLFRCYHGNQELLLPPFSEEQVRLIKSGAIPAGDL